MQSAILRRTGVRTATVVLLLLLPASLRSQTLSADDLRRQALAQEQRGDWVEACRLYDEAFRKDRTKTECRQAYQRCLRQYNLQRRHIDPGYRDVLARLTPDQALSVYEEVLLLISSVYFDRDKTDLNSLFHEGLSEVRFALDDARFRKTHFPGIPIELINAFKDRLDEWNDHKVGSRFEAREEVVAVVRTAQEMGLGVRSNLQIVLALEFSCGACNALDEYTLFLTPGHYAELQAQLLAKTIGVGIEVNARFEIERVYPKSPASEEGLVPGTRILKINQKSIDQIPPAAIPELLRGEAGSAIVLEVLPPGQMMPRMPITLVRRALVVPSVDYRVYEDVGGPMMERLGYLRVYTFQDSTLQEVKEALARLQTEGVKGLVIDLRGNPGGLFKSAISVAELFLGTNVVAYSRSQLKKYNRLYPDPKDKSDISNPVQLPLVVLVDAETASSAEVLAGALKEQYRPWVRLLGQTTYGKGSIQSTIPLHKSQGGIRITVAQLFSPSRQPYTGRGVAPHVFIEVDGEAGINAAMASLLESVRMLVR